ncbi:hypothetical protein [Bdellovibrio bacteriovorus]|uniref:Uncharacterized protein n=1 Tax=Bdellovibrio bacteriovorus str. Tiberius TaxID=1069642 RepID=K7ZBT1_BDEBC|nr:hypothetical protein [Bdellovibrio bacteriovorus]AFY02619.1 hypothetical protein Bdt_2944 [Bdellovibrio bacteriovorus str. Tiberius]
MKSILFVAMTFSSLTASAQEAVSPHMRETINKISQMRETLKISADRSGACETPQSPTCTFEGYCGKLAGKAQDFYLYQDSEGRQVPNMAMVGNLSFAEHCAKGTFPQSAVQDPFVYANQFMDEAAAGGKEQLQRNKERLKKETARTLKIVEDARNHVVKALEVQKTSANGKQIDNMIARVKAIKYRAAKTDGRYMDLVADGCESPNAYYSSEENTITVCPQMMNLPEASLFATLAHEFGHGIDPCAMEMDFGKEGAKLPDFMSLVVKPNQPTVNAAVRMAQNPFKNVISCLQSPQSIEVSIPTKDALLREINEFEDGLKAEVGDEIDEETGETKATDATDARFEDSRQNIEKNYERYKYCSEITGTGHIQEAFSDWISAQALTSKISGIQDSAKAKEYAFGSQTMFYGTACAEVTEAVDRKMDQFVESCPQLEEIRAYMEDMKHSDGHSSHPDANRRINRIYYAKPELQKALGCDGGSNDAQECKP